MVLELGLGEGTSVSLLCPVAPSFSWDQRAFGIFYLPLHREGRSVLPPPISPQPRSSLLEAALSSAAARRAELLSDPDLNALRLLHDQGEEVEGLAIDRYGPLLLASAYDPSWESDEGVGALRQAFPGEPVFLRPRSAR